MNGAHFHLLVNHLPIVGTIFGLLILLSGIVIKNNIVKQTGLATLIFAALSSGLALLTGDPAGETVENLPGITEAMIEHHESIAYSSLWALVPMGLLAALAFYSILKKEKAGNTLALVTLTLAVVSIGMMSWTGLTGGEIRHTEIRKDAVMAAPADSINTSEQEDDD